LSSAISFLERSALSRQPHPCGHILGISIATVRNKLNEIPAMASRHAGGERMSELRFAG